MSTIFPKQLVGIYIDHHNARIIDARTNATRMIQTKYVSRLREKGQSAIGTQLGNYRSTNNEATEHHQEQHDTKAYYKAIADAILPYDEIYLFGPTTAKDEFQNFLLHDSHFKSKIIRVESMDYASVNQQNAQVQRHFKSKL
jgi:hypothetical protein